MWCACCQCAIPACPEIYIDVRDGQVRECSASPMCGDAIIELGCGPSSGGYVHDLVMLGQAVMEHDKGCHPISD